MRYLAVAFVSIISSPAAFALECPNYNLLGAEGTFSAKELYSPKSFSVTAGGDLRLQSCKLPFKSDRGGGYVTERPDFSIGVHGLQGYSLEFRVDSECDAVLVVNTGETNWYYDDDDNGNLDPKITLTRPSEGIYDIWVGTTDGVTCEGTLTMETF